MTMGSLFGSAYAEQDYASQNPGDIPSYPWAPNYEPEEDPAALWAQQEEELRQQGLMAQFAYPSGAPATYGPQYVPSALEQAASGIGGSVLGNISNFAQENLLPALQQTIIGGRPIGYSQGPAAFPAPTYGQGAQAEIPYAVGAQEAFGDVGQSLGDPVGLGGVGRFIAGSLMPTNVGDVALMSGLAGTATTPFEAITGIPSPLGAIRGGVDNAIRFASPEPQLYPGLSGGLPPPGAIPDPFGNPPIEAFNDPIERAIVNQTYSGQGAIGGEAAPIQGRIPTGVENEAARLDAEMRQMFPQPSGAPPIETSSQVGEIVRGTGGRSSITAPDGSRIEWRNTDEGAHILQVTAMTERQGMGTRLREQAIADIRAQNPGAVITSDVTTEAGVRLANRTGATFTDFAGRPVSMDEAIKLARENKGPQSVLNPPTPPPASLTPEADSLLNQLSPDEVIARSTASRLSAEEIADTMRQADLPTPKPEGAPPFDLEALRGRAMDTLPAGPRLDYLIPQSGAVRPAQLDAMSGLAAREAGLSSPIGRG